MKKTFLLLLISSFAIAQTNPISHPKIKITASTKKNDATRVVVQDSITKEYHWQLNGSFMKLSDISGKENQFNKQNSLATDGTGIKYPTVDATNIGLATKLNLINAKQAGAIGNGVTDDTTILQSYLDNGQGTYIFPKADYLVSGLDVNSNSKLIFEKGARLLLKNNSDRSVLQNKNFASNVDKNIEIHGLEIEGNEANQIKISITAPYIGEPTVGLRFFGVENLKIIGAKINKTRTYGIWLSRITNGIFRDIEFNQSLVTIDNQDGIHFNGLCYNLEIENIRGITNDDMIALNANDVAQGLNVSLGEIKNVTIKDIIFNNNLNGIRLLSAGNLLDKVTIDNLSGNVRDNVVAISSYNLGIANFGAITINQVKVDTNTPVNVMGEYGGYILVNDKIEYLKISNVYRKVGADARPTIRVQGRADINKIEIENVTSVINQSLVTYYPDLSIENGSILGNFFVKGYKLMNGVFPNGYFIGSTGSVIGKLHLNNLYAEQIGYGLYLNNTDIGTVIVDGLSTNNIRYPFYLELDSDVAGLISDNNNWAYTAGSPSVYNILDTSSIVYYNRGTPNKLVKWGSTIDQKDSVLFDDGASIGLNTTSPSGKFSIVGGSDTFPSIALGNYLGFGWGFLERATDGNLDIRRVVSGVSNSVLLFSRSTGAVTFASSVKATAFNKTDGTPYVGILPVTETGTSFSLTDAYNGKVVVLTASCTVTIPDGLIAGFECSFTTLAGVTLTIAKGVSVVLFNNVGTTMAEKSSFTLKSRTATNNYITSGNL